jgi:hypothetical protein
LFEGIKLKPIQNRLQRFPQEKRKSYRLVNPQYDTIKS